MPVWTAGKLLGHINDRLDAALKEGERIRKKFEEFDI
jgi:hypothetical protein